MISRTQYQICMFKIHRYTKQYYIIQRKMYFQRTYIKHIRVASEEGRNMSGNWNVGKKRKALLTMWTKQYDCLKSLHRREKYEQREGVKEKRKNKIEKGKEKVLSVSKGQFLREKGENTKVINSIHVHYRDRHDVSWYWIEWGYWGRGRYQG